MTIRQASRQVRENCYRWRQEHGRNLGLGMFANTSDGLSYRALAYHTNLVYFLQKGQHMESNPEDRTKKPCTRCPCFALPPSSPHHHGQEQELGWEKGRGCVFFLGVTLWVPLYSGCRAHPHQPLQSKRAFQELSSQSTALTNIMLANS